MRSLRHKLLLFLWTVISPPLPTTVDLELSRYYACKSANTVIHYGFTAAILLYNSFLLVLGVLLAFYTRNVPTSRFNESQNIGISVYNLAVLSILTV